MNLKNTFKKIISFTAALVLAVGFIPSISSSAAASYESGYDFNEIADMNRDLSGQFPLIEYNFDPFTPEVGHSGFGISSFFQLESEMFSGLSDFTLAFWLQLDHVVSYNERVFYAGAESDIYPHISFELAPGGLYTVNFYDGTETATVSFTAMTEDWTHIAVTFKSNYFGGNTLAIYYNGIKMGETRTNVDLSRISGRFSYMTNFFIDDLFISSKALPENDVAMMQIMELADFMEYRGNKVEEPSVDWPIIDPDDPIGPDEPIIPEVPTLPEGWVFPEGLTKTDFTWIAYTFDGSFNAEKDLNKQVDAKINSFDSTLITVGDAKQGGGRGLTRRSAIFPEQYMSLDSGLLFDAEEFTIAMKVYRETDKESDSYKFSNMNLFEFTGKGSLVFSPFKTDEAGEKASKVVLDTEKDYGNDPFYIDITPEKTYDLTKTSLSSVNKKWVHYAFTFSSTGTVNVYVNGVLTNTFETGVALTDLDLTELKLMTGSSETDESRYYIDDVYVASRVLEAADIRRIEHYGVSRFVTEVLADPNPDDKTEAPKDPSSEVDLRPDSTDELEDGVRETAVINGFVGTTFDNMSLIGADYNNSVFALIRNASLAQGNINYGLALDGMSSYIRYPLGILDNADEFTVSIAYNWAGSTSGTNHRLFDFSRKENSVSAPTAYMYLDMGNGSDGLKFVMSDGTSEFVLETDHCVTKKWVRVSVTLNNGVVRLYIDGAEVASGETSIKPSDIKPNYNYVGKSGIKGGSLFKGTVDEIYISDDALTAVELQTIQAYGIEPHVSTGTDPVEVVDEIDIWDAIINGVVLTAVVLIVILVIVIIVTIFKR